MAKKKSPPPKTARKGISPALLTAVKSMRGTPIKRPTRPRKTGPSKLRAPRKYYPRKRFPWENPSEPLYKTVIGQAGLAPKLVPKKSNRKSTVQLKLLNALEEKVSLMNRGKEAKGWDTPVASTSKPNVLINPTKEHEVWGTAKAKGTKGNPSRNQTL